MHLYRRTGQLREGGGGGEGGGTRLGPVFAAARVTRARVTPLFRCGLELSRCLHFAMGIRSGRVGYAGPKQKSPPKSFPVSEVQSRSCECVLDRNR